MHLPYHKHLLAPAHPGECDRLPEPVREREPGGYRGGRDTGHVGEHRGSDPVLQGDGEKKEKGVKFFFNVIWYGNLF